MIIGNVTEDDLFAALDADLMVEQRQPGDIDAKQVADRYKRTRQWARNVMHKYEEQGLYTCHTVRGNAGKPVLVWRKVSSN